MFSSTLSSLTYWKTLLHNHHKSAESTLNNKNSQREDTHTAAGLYYTPEPLTWDLQTPGCRALWTSQNWQAARSPLSWDLRTFDQHFGHFGVAGTESAVDLKGRRNTGKSRPEKRGFSVRREGFWEKYIRYHDLRWINLVNACEWCTTTVVSQKHGIIITHIQKTWYMPQKHGTVLFEWADQTLWLDLV